MISPQPHKCLQELDAVGVNQYVIADKIGVNQSSVSRIRSQTFKRIDWQTVERIRALHNHVCIDSKLASDFLDYADYIKTKTVEES